MPKPTAMMPAESGAAIAAKPKPAIGMNTAISARPAKPKPGPAKMVRCALSPCQCALVIDPAVQPIDISAAM
ncbi:hypothetical protein D3C72_1862260 [compost metagenome]